MDTFSKLALSPTSPARVRYEATVGAGLPVLAALSRVVSAHDRVTLIAGSFSGTLGYVMSGLQVCSSTDARALCSRATAHALATASRVKVRIAMLR
jgi:homoserine dehydrogenase